MTLPSSTENSGAGNPLQTDTVPAGREYPVVKIAGSDGHIIGTKPDYILNFAPAANAANRILGDIWNGSASGIMRVRGVWFSPTYTAITGAAIDWILGRTTAIGTGGTAVTFAPMDTANPAVISGMSARANPTGGATAGTELFRAYTLNEETSAAFQIFATINQLPQINERLYEVVLRPGEGFAVRQSAVANAVGLTGFMAAVTIDN